MAIDLLISEELLEDFRTYLIQKRIDDYKYLQKQKQNYNYRNLNNNHLCYYEWIEHLIQTPIENWRKLVIDLVLSPYLINVRKLSYQESYTIIRNWFDKCYNPNKDLATRRDILTNAINLSRNR